MRHTRSWMFVVLPLLYLSVALGLVGIQFSKKSDTFSQSLGDLTISGKAANGGQPTELSLKGRGLEFAFDATHVLTAVKGNDTVKLRPLSWAWKDGNAVVSFQQGLQLVFEKGDGGRSILIRPAGDGAKRFTTLRIPFAAAGGSRLSIGTRGTFMEVVQSKQRVLASVDGARDRIELDHTFVVSTGPQGYRPVRLDSLAAGLPADLAWLTLDTSANIDQAEAALGTYWDKAYANWGSASFSTNLAAAWGSEALRRGDYPSAFARLQTLQRQARAAWSFDAVPFLGNVVELTVQHRRAIETESSRSQPDWAANGRLWWEASLYGPEGSADRVQTLLLTGDLPTTAPALAGLLENLLLLQATQSTDAVRARLDDVQTALRALVVRQDGALYVVGANGLLDLKTGLRVGRLWLTYARALAQDPYGVAGAQLVLSALALADTAGRVPEFLVTQDGRIVRQEGKIAPEDIYETVYPASRREILLPEWGPTSFVRAPSTVTSQKISALQARFSFRFPTGSAEHIIVTGVPAFDHITLHGIRWRTDPQFQSYTDGWYYSASTKTLYVKIKHREDVEELIVHFQPEE